MVEFSKVITKPYCFYSLFVSPPVRLGTAVARARPRGAEVRRDPEIVRAGVVDHIELGGWAAGALRVEDQREGSSQQPQEDLDSWMNKTSPDMDCKASEESWRRDI